MAIRLTVLAPGGGEAAALDFDQTRIRIGRGAMCDVRLPELTVSAVHAMVFLDRDRYYVTDLGSTNGTEVNGERLVVDRRKLLRSGDTIRVARFEIRFQAGVAMLSAHSQERTLDAARRLARHIVASGGADFGPAALVVLGGPQDGERFELPPPPARIVIGRAPECDFVLEDGEVSRRNVELEVSDEGVRLRDLGGKNAPRVGGRDVTDVRLRDRDEVMVGATVLVLDEPLEGFLRDLGERPEAETEPAEPRPASKDEPASTADHARAAPVAERAQAPDPPPEGDEQDRPSAPSGKRQQVPTPQPGQPRRPSSSRGTEIAVLLVGALALAACVGALVWLFR
jgi:pSer/pThr/pTyr-binding forkhead associated (FHA) protein